MTTNEPVAIIANTNQPPLDSIEARYADLLRQLGVNGHDGALSEIAMLRNAVVDTAFLKKPSSDQYFQTIWVPVTDPKLIRRLNKSNEELSELLKANVRALLQGLDGIDPATNETNLTAITKETADVLAQCECTIKRLNLDRDFIEKRRLEKIQLMTDWEGL